MDPQTDLPDLVEDLEVNIDELTEILSPLLNTSLSTTASSLPLLDKSKLYVLAAYSIESLLYSTLQASGVNAKEHAIFKELGRLKGYFGKIKNVEEKLMAPSAPKSKLDVGAAARFIKAGLAGNDKYDLERAERMAKEKARAQLKARQINKKFDDNGEVKAQSPTPKKRDADEMDIDEPVQDDEEVIGGLEEPEAQAAEAEQPASKKMRTLSVAAGPMDIDSAPSPAPQSNPDGKKKKEKRKKRGKKGSKSAEISETEVDSQLGDEPEETEQVVPHEAETESQPEPAKSKRGKKVSKPTETSEAEVEADLGPTSPSSPPTKKKRKHRGKNSKKINSAEVSDVEAEEATTTATPARTAKTRSATSLSSPAVAPSPAAGEEPEKPKRGRGRPPKAKN